MKVGQVLFLATAKPSSFFPKPLEAWTHWKTAGCHMTEQPSCTWGGAAKPHSCVKMQVFWMNDHGINEIWGIRDTPLQQSLQNIFHYFWKWIVKLVESSLVVIIPVIVVGSIRLQLRRGNAHDPETGLGPKSILHRKLCLYMATSFIIMSGKLGFSIYRLYRWKGRTNHNFELRKKCC